MIDVNKKGEVWVFAEQHAGKLEDVPVELLSKGRELADQLGVVLRGPTVGYFSHFRLLSLPRERLGSRWRTCHIGTDCRS